MLRKISTILILAMCISLGTFAGIQDSIGVNKIGDKLHIIYMVEPGETVYGISTKYGVPVSDLLELNPDLENGLKVGQIINIPYNPSLRVKTADENAIVHKVQPGETLYGIAKKYNTSVNSILRYNNMELKAGQDLVVGYKNQPVNPSNTPSTPPSMPDQKKEYKDPSKTPAENVVITTAPSTPGITPYPYDASRKQILIIPFDPYLYFSDADAEIAAKSNMAMPKVRQIFRRRLNALLDASAYETIHLLGGKTKDSTSDLNKIYGSVNYGYQDALYNPENPRNAEFMAADQPPKEEKSNMKEWLEKQKSKMSGNSNTSTSKYDVPKDHGKYFGVKIKDPEFFNYFNTKYSVDYYVFINQFEVKTDYETCLDRSALNYERTFVTHYSIFDSNGKQIAGNKFKTHYNSNSNYVYTIVSDNMPKIVDRILSDIPPPNKEIK